MPPKLIDLFHPYVPSSARIKVNEVLNSRWIGQAHRVDEFESKFAKKFNLTHCVSVSSGTAALETAYDLLDLQPGDEVITTPFTCSATNLPLLHRRCKIVWADVLPTTLCIDPADVRAKITDRTAAIVQVHVGGIKADVGNVGIPVVSDAAQALGIFNGTYTCCSFQAIKHITTGDGGMLVCGDDEDYKRAKLMRWFGIDREKKVSNSWQCYKERQMTFDIEMLGYKRHMNDIAAAMGIAGLAEYDCIIDYRKTLFDTYKEELKGIDGITILDGPENKYWLCTVLVENRDDFAKMLFVHGIDNNLVHLRNDIYAIFGGRRAELSVLNELESKYICLPLNMKVTVDDVKYICDKIRKGW